MTSERTEFARQLRKHATHAEDLLWRCLWGSRFHGAKFRRQVPLDRYVVDFHCHAAKLVIELDGRQHEWFSDYDGGRSEVLERLGVRVIRFTNEDVCSDLDSVLARIRQELRLPFD
ncbi:MAG: endonuclease domain-containing protein [Hyphomicrobiales bacterium]|nr:endonuclease domain-containing protein [Hyphomicrobiales bacterium]MBV8439953.1 endonuclease domain-containing protein [Hyphomicrobiales bacterium]